jgi:hypothetical protein
MEERFSRMGLFFTRGKKERGADRENGSNLSNRLFLSSLWVLPIEA